MLDPGICSLLVPVFVIIELIEKNVTRGKHFLFAVLLRFVSRRITVLIVLSSAAATPESLINQLPRHGAQQARKTLSGGDRILTSRLSADTNTLSTQYEPEVAFTLFACVSP